MHDHSPNASSNVTQPGTGGEGVDRTLLGPGRNGSQSIPVNMYETTDALVIVAPMPGVSAEDVEVSVDGDTVLLRAALRTAAPKTYLLHEWEYGLYERSVDLPGPYRGPISATLGHGQLAVSLKREGSRASDGSPIHPTGA